MKRFTRLAAVAAASVSLAAVAAAPATAQTDAIAVESNPCLEDPGLPQCPQWVIDVADRTVEYAQRTYDEEVQPKVDEAACIVVETLTDRTCD